MADDRNRQTAEVYDRLGLPEFFALEGFVQWRGADAELAPDAVRR